MNFRRWKEGINPKMMERPVKKSMKERRTTIEGRLHNFSFLLKTVGAALLEKLSGPSKKLPLQNVKEQLSKFLDFVFTNLGVFELDSEATEDDRNAAEENSKRRIRNFSKNFHHIRDRKDDDYLFIGRFLVAVMVLEKNLSDMLESQGCSAEGLMLGKKIDHLKVLLSEWEARGEDCSEIRLLVQPLKELSAVRGRIVHSLEVRVPRDKDFGKIRAYVKSSGRSFVNTDDLEHVKSNRDRLLILLYNFVILACEKIAFLDTAD